MKQIYLVMIGVTAVIITGCRKEIGGTNVRIKDPVRHYIPVLQGDELQMIWRLYNDGPNPLIISDIQPPCSAIRLVSEQPSLIPVGDSAIMVFIYSSEENINLAKHTIRIFGNINPKGVAEMSFDVSVVRPTPNHTDFEERLLKRLHQTNPLQSKTRKNDYRTDDMQTHEYFEY